jgi:hypothetical protein
LASSKAEQGDPDALTWKWLSDVIKQLGSDGMSSEESGDEEMTAVYRLRTMPWRRNITNELKLIDRQKDPQASCRKGPKPAKRIRLPNALPSARKPVEELPAAFYDSKWLSENPGTASKVPFQWKSILTT